MFIDIWIARQSALSLARNRMVATMVLAVGTHQYAVIAAEDLDGSLTIVNHYDPFGDAPEGWKRHLPLLHFHSVSGETGREF